MTAARRGWWRRSHLATLVPVLAIAASAPMPLFLVGAVALLIERDFEIQHAEFGAGVAAFFVCAAISAVWGGVVVDRIGWRRAIRLAAVGELLTCVGLAMAQNFLQLILLLGVGGVWLSIGVPAASRALIQEMPGRRRGLLFGIGQTAAPIGTIFAGIVLPGVALDHGWHAVFLAAMVFPAVAFLTVGRDTGAGAGPRPAARPPDRANPSRREVRDLLTLTVACGLGAVAIGGLTSFFVVSAVDAGQSDARAGHLLVLGGVVGIATRIVGGWYSDRSRHDPLWAVSLLLFAGSGGLALLATGSSGLVVVATVLVYGAGWGWPGLFYYGVAIRGGAFPGRATGTVQVGMALGNVLGPLVVGQISSRDDAGFGAAWSVMAALTLLASVVVLGPLRGRDRVNS